jgi:hypothetical protein
VPQEFVFDISRTRYGPCWIADLALVVTLAAPYMASMMERAVGVVVALPDSVGEGVSEDVPFEGTKI